MVEGVSIDKILNSCSAARPISVWGMVKRIFITLVSSRHLSFTTGLQILPQIDVTNTDLSGEGCFDIHAINGGGDSI